MTNKNIWHTISAEETARRLKVSEAKGLPAGEVRRRRARYGRNRIWHIARLETGRYLLRTAGDLSTILLAITAVLALLFEDSGEAAVVCVILTAGAVLRVVTYIKAKRILEENASENIPTATVLRGGAVRSVVASELVPGDVVFLHAGDTVPCDGRIAACGDTLISESGVTNNRETTKTSAALPPSALTLPTEKRRNMLYAGTVVLQGDIRMIATATGRDTLVWVKQGGIEIPSGDSLPLLQRLGGFCKVSELLMLAFVLVISAVSLFTQTGAALDQVFFVAISMAAASMSEYLVTIGSIIIAIAAKRTDGAVIKDCAKLEEIAAADSVILGDVSLLKSGETSLDTCFLNGALRRKEELANEGASLAFLLRLASEAVGLPTGNPALALSTGEAEPALTGRALAVRNAKTLAAALFSLEEAGAKNPPSLTVERVAGTVSLSGGLDTAIQQRPGSDSAYVAVLGDVPTVLAGCTSCRSSKGDLPLTEETCRTILTEAARLRFLGAELFAVSTRPSPYLTLSKIATLHSEMCFVGFVSLAEMPAKGTVEAIRRLRAANLRVTLLSSDPERDLYYGHEVGLFNKKTKTVPISSIPSPSPAPTTQETLLVTVPPYTRKSESDLSVSALRYKAVATLAKGAAFLTKEPLDARAMAEVSCGIAVSRAEGRSVAQALKNQAAVVVYPPSSEDHGGFPQGVASLISARRAMINITNAARYLVASQLSRLCLLLFGVLVGVAMPGVSAILASGLLFDFAAVLAMAFEKAPDDALSLPCSPMTRYGERMRCAAIWGVVASLLCAAIPFLADRLTAAANLGPLDSGGKSTLVSASLFLSQLALAGQFMKRGRLLRRGTTFNLAFGGYAIATVVVTLLTLSERHTAAVFGGTVVPAGAAALVLIPPAALVLGIAWVGVEKRQ